MSVNMECSGCGHIQPVGIVANGKAGYVDPKTECEKCGKKGSGFFAPGKKAEMDERITEARESIFEVMDDLMPPKAPS